MLEKQLNKIKNLILIKFIVCVLLFCVFSYTLFSFVKQNQYSTQNLKQATGLLENIQEKVSLIKLNHEKLLEAEKYYKQILHEPANALRMQRLKLIQIFNSAGDALKLGNQFKIDISSSALNRDFTSNNQWVVAKNNDANIKFAAKNFEQFITIASSLYDMAPEYKSIQSLKITKNDVLSAEDLEHLVPGTEPKLIQGEINLKIRSIKLDKDKIFSQ